MTTTHTIDVEAERQMRADYAQWKDANNVTGGDGLLLRLFSAGWLAAKRSIQPTIAPVTALTPKWEGEFKNFEQWVNKAQSWLASPSHRPAVCIDAKGRRCAIGKDFMLARDEDAFPVRFFWECQPTIAAEDVRDAARYRFATGWYGNAAHIDWSASKDEIDSAIDAAIAATTTPKGEA